MNPLILIILDGWGLRDESKDNGIALAHKPFFDHLWQTYPHTKIDGSGPAVGLPQGIMGNSEVGHMNLGAGRIVLTGLSQIYQAIDDQSFFKNPALLGAIKAVQKNQSVLHLMGLLSDGAVHSHQDHLYALLEFCKRKGVGKIFIHCFMDGRDTPPKSGIKYIEQLEQQIKQIGVGQIASVSGRYYAMDRDKRWDRVQKAYDVLTGIDQTGYSSAKEIIQKSYAENVGDEFVVPRAVIDSSGKPIGPVHDQDAVIFFNFRPDRAREMTRALTDESFKEFNRSIFPKLSQYVCMSTYDESLNLPVAFSPSFPTQTFGEVISLAGLKQLRIAETEKYAHVTYFFSGGEERIFKNEERKLIPSPREVATYDLKPEMSAYLVADEVVKRLESNQHDVIILNFANADMVGHTAKPKAIIRAVEVVDECLSRVIPSILKHKGCALVIADHGNAELMVDENGNPHTAHTTNLVPFILVSEKYKKVTLQKEGGRLCDVAPTMLEILKIKKPGVMTGGSLIDRCS